MPSGVVAYVTARFRAPATPGTTTEHFVLRTLAGVTLADSGVAITIISTTADAPAPTVVPMIPIAPAPSGAEANFIPFLPQYKNEPTMRVGVAYYKPTNTGWVPQRIRATVPVRVTREDGGLIATVPAGTAVNIDYRPTDRTYHIHINNTWYTEHQPIRVTPTTSAPLELASYTKKLVWEGNRADNHFRGTIEIRYASTGYVWTINELPLEEYLKGLVETNDRAPAEFHAAQVIAARSFALFHIASGGKYTKGKFVLTGTASDQVYRGDDGAKRRPNLVRAVEATRGIVMTYDDRVAVTPYFAQSNGSTRDYTSVWGGAPKAWLASVADPPICTGKRLIGHGVGMSQRCAMQLASNGWNFQSILHHFYTGVALQKVYE